MQQIDYAHDDAYVGLSQRLPVAADAGGRCICLATSSQVLWLEPVALEQQVGRGTGTNHMSMCLHVGVDEFKHHPRLRAILLLEQQECGGAKPCLLLLTPPQSQIVCVITDWVWHAKERTAASCGPVCSTCPLLVDAIYSTGSSTAGLLSCQLNQSYAVGCAGGCDCVSLCHRSESC